MQTIRTASGTEYAIDWCGVASIDGILRFYVPNGNLVELILAFSNPQNLPVTHLFDGEVVQEYTNYPRNIIKFQHDEDSWHPTQKPVSLIRYLVRTYTNEGDTVLDNCMGSGTTAVACIKEKRHFIGFELNKDYFDKATKRIKAEQSQLCLF